MRADTVFSVKSFRLSRRDCRRAKIDGQIPVSNWPASKVPVAGISASSVRASSGSSPPSSPLGSTMVTAVRLSSRSSTLKLFAARQSSYGCVGRRRCGRRRSSTGIPGEPSRCFRCRPFAPAAACAARLLLPFWLFYVYNLC